MKKATRDGDARSPRTKWLSTTSLLAVGGWLFVVCAAEAGNRLGENPSKIQGQPSYQLRQVVVSAKLEKGKDDNTVTLSIETVKPEYKKLKTVNDAAVEPVEWMIDLDGLIDRQWWQWKPRTIWKTDNLVYGDCLQVATDRGRTNVMMLRPALGTGRGMLTLDDDDLSLRNEEEESSRRLNVNITGNYADAKKMLEETCEGEKAQFGKFSAYATRDRTHTVLHGEEPRFHGPIVIIDPEACPAGGASEACKRLRTALKAARCNRISTRTLWGCPNPGGEKWEQVVRENDGTFVAAGRSIEDFGPDVVGIDGDAMAAWTELAGVGPEHSKWINGMFEYGKRSGSPVKISLGRDGNKVWAYVPKGKWHNKITWRFVCSPTEPQAGKFDFRKVEWHKLKVNVKADDGTKHVADGWQLSVPSEDGTQIILDQNGTTEVARILARFARVTRPKGMVELTLSPPRGELELIYESVVIIANRSRLCPVTANRNPNEFVLDIEPSPRTLTLSVKHFAGVAQKVMLPSTGPEQWIRLSDKATSIEVNTLTKIKVIIEGRATQPEKRREFVAALKQQNQEERCAALRNLFPRLYTGRVVIYAPDTANIPVRILRQGGRAEVGFTKRIVGGFQTYGAQGDKVVEVLTNGAWEQMSPELGCDFEGIGPRSAYVIVDTGGFFDPQGKLGKAEECDDDDLDPLERFLLRCDSQESVSTVSDSQMLEALWIRCHERLYGNLVAAGADQIEIVQAHPDRQGNINFSRVARVPLSLYDETSAIRKLADVGYELRRSAETSLRSEKSERGMSGLDLARAHLETLAPHDDATKKVPMYVVFSRPHGPRDGQSQPVDMETGAQLWVVPRVAPGEERPAVPAMETGAQLWVVPGLLMESSCPIAQFDANNITEGENQ